MDAWIDVESATLVYGKRIIRLSSVHMTVAKKLLAVSPRPVRYLDLGDLVGGGPQTLGYVLTTLRKRLQPIGLDLHYTGKNSCSIIEYEGMM